MIFNQSIKPPPSTKQTTHQPTNRLKSVAHLPWKAMMYKSINTFIDDLFAFVVKMPTLHRIACLRDDLVFLVFLYQVVVEVEVGVGVEVEVEVGGVDHVVGGWVMMAAVWFGGFLLVVYFV